MYKCKTIAIIKYLEFVKKMITILYRIVPLGLYLDFRYLEDKKVGTNRSPGVIFGQ